MPSVRPQLPYFRVGEAIPATGVYRVYHNAHRVSHEVLLYAGEKFPRCNKCGEDVHFELIVCAMQDQQMRAPVHIFEIPHPEEETTA